MNRSLIILLCVSVICAVRGTPINNNNNNNNNNNDNSNKNLNSHQDTNNSENNLIRIIDNVDSEKSLQLFGGLSIERIDNDDNKNIEGGRYATTFSSTTDKFLNRIENYLNTHELQFNWPNEENEIIESGRSEVEEESRTRKLKKLLLPLLIALKLKLGLIVPLMMLVIKAISIKGLISGFLALLFSGATFFREMVSRKKDHITTAYITGHPLNAEIVHSTDWHRSGQASAQELAYAGYNYHTLPAGAY